LSKTAHNPTGMLLSLDESPGQEGPPRLHDFGPAGRRPRKSSLAPVPCSAGTIYHPIAARLKAMAGFWLPWGNAHRMGQALAT